MNSQAQKTKDIFNSIDDEGLNQLSDKDLVDYCHHHWQQWLINVLQLKQIVKAQNQAKLASNNKQKQRNPQQISKNNNLVYKNSTAQNIQGMPNTNTQNFNRMNNMNNVRPAQNISRINNMQGINSPYNNPNMPEYANRGIYNSIYSNPYQNWNSSELMSQQRPQMQRQPRQINYAQQKKQQFQTKPGLQKALFNLFPGLDQDQK